MKFRWGLTAVWAYQVWVLFCFFCFAQAPALGYAGNLEVGQIPLSGKKQLLRETRKVALWAPEYAFLVDGQI